MSYVNSVLQPGERVIMRGRLHWIVYWHAILFFVLGIVLVAWEPPGAWEGMLRPATAIAFGVLFVLSFAHAWFIRWITEIAVTDRRIIYKRGFINRHTEEMNMDKVASVDVDQSILGRVLDYGTVHVMGTGGGQVVDRPGSDRSVERGIEHLHRIASPLALRNAITAK
jgi:uncharacterized membrane protein YdbT with pleckstrin-like domain